jgi:DNA-directed RNA polymerase II subunit RPB2
MNVQLDWNVIDAYFASKVHYITDHHIVSFDTFLNEKIPYILRTLNPFVIIKNENKVKYEIHVYMGGKDASKITLTEPCFVDDNKKYTLFPNTARLNNVTYASEMKVDVLIEYHTYKDGNTTEPEILQQTFTDIHIGTIPIMLQSSLCVVNALDVKKRVAVGECPYDQGGYFIIDGKEKVIVSQERVATNKLFLTHVHATDTTKSDYSHIGIIRCTSKQNSLFPKTIKLMAFNRDVLNAGRYQAIVVTIPNVKLQHIPLFILFRALGIESDDEILRYVFLDHNKANPKYLGFIRKTVHEGSIVYTQTDAIQYIARYCKYNEPNYVKHVLKTDVFPNMGTSFTMKATYLGYLVMKFVRFALGDIEGTNRDSYLCKRVDVSGVLMTNMFRDGYNELRNNIKNTIDKEYVYGNYKNMTELENAVVVAKHKIFDSQIVSAFIKKSFKGKWGVLDVEGVVQDLNRLSYIGYISHVRRVNTPMDRSLKLVTPHRSDASQWGYMCPIESPDGGNIGLLKHLATGCDISEEQDEDDMMKCLLYNGVQSLRHLYCTNLANKTKILLNNNWVGIHDDAHKLITSLRILKQNAIIHPHTSISWDIIEDEIEIFNDAGRCVRPVYIADSKSQTHIKEILSHEKTDTHKIWGLLTPDVTKKQPFDERDAETVLTNENSRKPIEYIDPTEMSRAHIAMYRSYIEDNPLNKYDYIEIHPSLILSLYTNLIPLAHHNQAPRNIFSGQQGKQAVGVYATSFNDRIDTASYILHYPQQGILTTKYSKYTHTDKLPNGENVIVAIATYTGYNQEDSLIFNKSSVERGLFNSSIYKAHIESEDSNEQEGEHIYFDNPIEMLKNGTNINVKYAKWDKIDEDGFPIENVYITEDDVYMGKVKKTVSNNPYNSTQEKTSVYTDKSTVASFIDGGMIEKVCVYNKNGNKQVKIRFRKTREPVMGDKFASRHGQKGVIGMIIPQEDMPFNKDGLVPDIIVNPHAFPSRMTIGHLIESVLTKYACVSGNLLDATVFETIDTNTYFEALAAKGFNKYGDDVLYNGFTGEQIATEIFFGPTFYYRLKHMVNDKMNFRGGNDPAKTPVTGTTRQPTHGRANKGGLRIGEMETNALISHGMGSFIKESMMERSDKYKFSLDVDAGTFAIPYKQSHYSQMDTENKHFTYLHTPYTFKLLTHEVQGMGIKTSLYVDEQEDVVDVVEEDAYFYTTTEEDESNLNVLTE